MTFKTERDYSPAVEALKPLITNLPFKIVSIDGLPGAGKTTLGRYLAYKFNVSLIETDLFIKRRNGTLNFHNSQIKRIIEIRKQRDLPVIVEGAIVL